MCHNDFKHTEVHTHKHTHGHTHTRTHTHAHTHRAASEFLQREPLFSFPLILHPLNAKCLKSIHKPATRGGNAGKHRTVKNYRIPNQPEPTDRTTLLLLFICFRLTVLHTVAGSAPASVFSGRAKGEGKPRRYLCPPLSLRPFLASHETRRAGLRHLK